MVKNKPEVLKECFALLDAEYGDKLNEQKRIFKKELFKKIIGQYPISKIQEMVFKIIKARKYSNFPKIAEMIEIIEGNKEEEAELAWIYLLEKIEKEGYYNSVAFPECPAITGVIEIWGGWPKFCESMKDDQQKWIKKEFIKVYPLVKKRGKYPAYNPGYFEITNNSKGYDEEMMKRLGMTIDGKRINQPKRISREKINK